VRRVRGRTVRARPVRRVRVRPAWPVAPGRQGTSRPVPGTGGRLSIRPGRCRWR